jgi:phospholipid-binding lipoprotein MlaA
MIKKTLLVLMSAGTLLLAGCASVPDTPRDPADPFEALNRQTFAFNMTLDRFVTKPIAEGYRFVTPKPVRDSVTRFYQNAGEPSNAVNNVLQGKVEDGILSLFRLMINTTVGVGGLFDVASHVGIPRKPEDFGQTMGAWGIPNGPYLVLPVLGPSNIRDAAGLVPEIFMDPNYYVDKDWIKWPVWGVRFVNTRERLLPITDMLEATVDPYIAARNAYIQQRAAAVEDGEAPVDQKPLLDPFAEDDDAPAKPAVKQ